ncbi:MAG: choice-of-anchor V domain-containing protein [Bacteroidia bacterium]
MKKILLFSSALIAILAISLSTLTYTFSSPGGAPAGATGSPADMNRTCARSGCHAGTAIPQSDMISSNVPASGYIPGETYQITVGITAPGISKWGFQISPQNDAGVLPGSLTLTDPARTRFIGTGNKYITHTSTGNSGASGSTSWSFNWTAPAPGTGVVVFHAAVMAANGNNGTSGDNVFSTNLSIQEDFSTSISESAANKTMFIYPNPAEGSLLSVKNIENAEMIVLRDLNGRIFTTAVTNTSSESIDLNIESLPKGVYIIEAGEQTQRFIRK